VCVYGDTSDRAPPVGVSIPAHPLDLYGESKVEAERLVTSSGIAYMILRISGISVPAFLEPPAIWPFRADQRIEFICRNDVVAALVACAEAERALGNIWNIAGGPTWRMLGREYVAGLNDAMGLPAEEARYSERPGHFDWYETGESRAVLGYQRTSYPQFLELLEGAIDAALQGWGNA